MTSDLIPTPDAVQAEIDRLAGQLRRLKKLQRLSREAHGDAGRTGDDLKTDPVIDLNPMPAVDIKAKG